jgi:hypothetical protein
MALLHFQGFFRLHLNLLPHHIIHILIDLADIKTIFQLGQLFIYQHITTSSFALTEKKVPSLVYNY